MNYREFLTVMYQEDDPEWRDIVQIEHPDFHKKYLFERSKNSFQNNASNNFKQNFKNRQIMKRNNNQGYNNNQNYGNQKPIVKHSGAKTKRYFPTTGPNAGVEQTLTSGWKLSNRDLISIRCVTTSKSKLSDKGWLGSIACTLTNTKSGVQSFHWGTMHHATGKVVIDSIAMVINPKAKNGGYSGTYINN